MTLETKFDDICKKVFVHKNFSKTFFKRIFKILDILYFGQFGPAFGTMLDLS